MKLYAVQPIDSHRTCLIQQGHTTTACGRTPHATDSRKDLSRRPPFAAPILWCPDCERSHTHARS